MFFSSLPALLAIHATRDGRTIDDESNSHTAVAV